MWHHHLQPMTLQPLQNPASRIFPSSARSCRIFLIFVISRQIFSFSPRSFEVYLPNLKTCNKAFKISIGAKLNFENLLFRHLQWHYTSRVVGTLLDKHLHTLWNITLFELFHEFPSMNRSPYFGLHSQFSRHNTIKHTTHLANNEFSPFHFLLTWYVKSRFCSLLKITHVCCWAHCHLWVFSQKESFSFHFWGKFLVGKIIQI